MALLIIFTLLLLPSDEATLRAAVNKTTDMIRDSCIRMGPLFGRTHEILSHLAFEQKARS